MKCSVKAILAVKHLWTEILFGGKVFLCMDVPGAVSSKWPIYGYGFINLARGGLCFVGAKKWSGYQVASARLSECVEEARSGLSLKHRFFVFHVYIGDFHRTKDLGSNHTSPCIHGPVLVLSLTPMCHHFSHSCQTHNSYLSSKTTVTSFETKTSTVIATSN